MVRADTSLFAGLGHYFAGMAQIQASELADDEPEALRQAAPTFERAVEEVRAVREREAKILDVAQSIEFSAYFVRRHEMVSLSTVALLQGLEQLTQDLADGYYPAEACTSLNRILSRMMSSFDQDARIEGVLTRLETHQPPGQ